MGRAVAAGGLAMAGYNMISWGELKAADLLLVLQVTMRLQVET